MSLGNKCFSIDKEIIEITTVPEKPLNFLPMNGLISNIYGYGYPLFLTFKNAPNTYLITKFEFQKVVFIIFDFGTFQCITRSVSDHRNASQVVSLNKNVNLFYIPVVDKRLLK